MTDSNTCNKCGQLLAEIADYCPPCRSKVKQAEASSRWRSRNPDYAKSYYQNNKDKRRSYVKSWLAKNPDKTKEYREKYHAKYPDALKNSHKKYQQNNPNYIKNKSARRRAVKKQNGSFVISKKELARLYASQCLYCNNPAQHIDHVIPISRGGRHSIGNLVPACAKCNLEKNDRFIMEWKMSRGHGKLNESKDRM